MKQKIEWYREVLELEPGSRVFFPLARLLAGDGQVPEAIITLRQGVLRHPDHVESRLLLVELLFTEGASSDLTREVEKLGDLLGSYPGFWDAWSTQLAQMPAMRDAALAVRFLSAALQGQPLSWTAVIEQGLRSALSTSVQDAVHSPTQHPEPKEFAPPAEQDAASLKPPVPAQLPAEPTLEFAFDEEEPQDLAAADDEVEEAEEAFSIRTRSMAEVLAEQGDLAGALDIYQELMQAAPAEEKPSLAARADELSRRMRAGLTQGSGETDEKIVHPGGESNRLVELLESLAQRLEARAR